MTTRTPRRRGLDHARVAAVLLLTAAFIAIPSVAQAAALHVNTTSDFVDSNPGDGVCSGGLPGACALRGAIMEANALPGPDTIFVPAGTYTLTRVGPGEDGSATGDLDITDTLTINGVGIRRQATIIDGNALNTLQPDRVLHIMLGVSVHISRVIVQHGDAVSGSDTGGGGIRNEGSLTLTQVIVRDNLACLVCFGEGDGGGILNLGSLAQLFLHQVTVTGNEASSGGGIQDIGGRISSAINPRGPSMVVVTGNAAVDKGGGIAIDQEGVVALSYVIIAGNEVLSGRLFGTGGGMDTREGLLGAPTVAISQFLIADNTAISDGGGISCVGCIATLLDGTISGNLSLGAGGGVFTDVGPFSLGGPTVLTNDTITANVAPVGSGIAWLTTQPIVHNTIVALDLLGSDCNHTVTSEGYNLDGGTSCGFTAPGDLHNANPLLGPLQDNDGFSHTHALLPGSPAIDAGSNTNCPSPDQRGVARPQDGNADGIAICDKGAFEVEP
jgi:hypothetical protein